MSVHLLEWIELMVRWVHVVTGVAWIGTSFYFNWLNNSFREPETERKGVFGEVWSVHGGAFYQVTKYTVAPATLPAELHWSKWEAYFTWLSGFVLLCLVYYLGADIYLTSGRVELSPLAAVGIGLGSLLLGWLVYDAMCRSPLRSKPIAFTVIGFAVVALASWGLCQLFGSRAAYIQVGAILGTLMAGNVFFVIIPKQKVMVAQLLAGQSPDAQQGKAGALRSLHNNYITLPVLFIMVSHHYPMTFGHQWNWVILLAISAIGALVRHWFNLRGQGHRNVWILPLAAVAMLALAVVSAPASLRSAPDVSNHELVSFAQVQPIIGSRCRPCHSQHPTHPSFPSAPQGLMLDTPEQIQTNAALIGAQAVQTQVMPLANLTKMTPLERETLGAWIQQGAKLD